MMSAIKVDTNNGNSIPEHHPCPVDCPANFRDCNGDCGGAAFLDCDGICCGGATGKECAVEDCNGVCGGCASKDCAGVCNGTAIIDCAGNCCGGETCKKCAVRDCAGVCNGHAIPDCHGVCGGNAVRDCAGVCGGNAVPDCHGVCGGRAVPDCAGVCDGPHRVDCAGVCGGCAVFDCEGICGGNATKDCAGICEGSHEIDCSGRCCNPHLRPGDVEGPDGTCERVCLFRDCAGVCGGSAAPDCAGCCNGDHFYDCAGVCMSPCDDDSTLPGCPGEVKVNPSEEKRKIASLVTEKVLPVGAKPIPGEPQAAIVPPLKAPTHALVASAKPNIVSKIAKPVLTAKAKPQDSEASIETSKPIVVAPKKDNVVKKEKTQDCANCTGDCKHCPNKASKQEDESEVIPPVKRLAQVAQPRRGVAALDDRAFQSGKVAAPKPKNKQIVDVGTLKFAYKH